MTRLLYSVFYFIALSYFVNRACAANFDPLQLNDGLVVSKQKKAEFSPELLTKGYKRAAELSYSHSLLVMRDGALIAEQYFHGYSASSPNNLKSITKSVTSILIGIALDKGLLKSINTPVVEFFPKTLKKVDDSRKNKITLKHLLTMSAGFDANDDLPGLNCSAHFYSEKCVFSRGLITTPGEKFSYTSAYVDILSEILTNVSGKSTKEFAEKYLFSPMGIKILGWSRNARGYYLGESELFLTSRDMTKFAFL